MSNSKFKITNEKTGQVFTDTAKELLRVMFDTTGIDTALAEKFSEKEAEKIISDFAKYCEKEARP